MRAPIVARACRHCSRWGNHELLIVVASNGSRQVRARCLHCESMMESVSHSVLPFMGLRMEDIPVLHDYSSAAHVCVVCGVQGSEWHHWAPKAVFGDDAERYPGDWLCVTCHQGWHRRMNGYDWTRAA